MSGVALTDGELSNLLWALNHTFADVETQAADPSQASAAGLLALKLDELRALRDKLSREYEARCEVADYEASQRRIAES